MNVGNMCSTETCLFGFERSFELWERKGRERERERKKISVYYSKRERIIVRYGECMIQERKRERNQFPRHIYNQG